MHHGYAPMNRPDTVHFTLSYFTKIVKSPYNRMEHHGKVLIGIEMFDMAFSTILRLYFRISCLSSKFINCPYIGCPYKKYDFGLNA